MLSSIFKYFFDLAGWKIVGKVPDIPKWVGIVAPHTSNWDFVVAMVVKTILGLEGSYVGKHQIFRWPFGYFLRKTGGIPVVRTEKNHLVDTLSKEFALRDRMIFASAPEGTRSYVPRFRTGFWAVAMAAKVPVVMIGLDFAKKEVQIQEPFMLSGDLQQDMDRIYAYFRTVNAKHPELTFLNKPRPGDPPPVDLHA
jgi:hypothetical protein